MFGDCGIVVDALIEILRDKDRAALGPAIPLDDYAHARDEIQRVLRRDRKPTSDTVSDFICKADTLARAA